MLIFSKKKCHDPLAMPANACHRQRIKERQDIDLLPLGQGSWDSASESEIPFYRSEVCLHSTGEDSVID